MPFLKKNKKVMPEKQVLLWKCSILLGIKLEFIMSTDNNINMSMNHHPPLTLARLFLSDLDTNFDWRSCDCKGHKERRI